jgi:regulatory protein
MADRRPPPPLDAAALERLALRYVERFATTRGKLLDYLRRKLRERGWDGADPPAPDAIADRFVALGYLDDRAWAEAKAAALARRGLGARRVNDALRHARVGETAEELAPDIAGRAAEAALAYARRRRFGPWARERADRDLAARQLAAMARAGHAPGLARAILALPPGAEVEPHDLNAM